MQGCQLRLPAGADAAALQITGLTADSREVRPGFLFAAIAGLRQDGARLRLGQGLQASYAT